MTDEEMRRFLEIADEYERNKQRQIRKKKARFYGSIVLFSFILAIIMAFLR